MMIPRDGDGAGSAVAEAVPSAEPRCRLAAGDAVSRQGSWRPHSLPWYADEMEPSPGVPLNVLMVAAQQTGGGAGRAGELLSAELQRHGHVVNSFVRDNRTNDPACHIATHWRVTPLMRLLAAHGFPELGNLTSFLWRSRAEYAGADVLHLHNIHGEYVSLAAMPLWGADKPIVWTLHDFWPLTGNCATPRSCTRWRQSCGRCPLLGVYPMSHVDRSRFYRWLKPRLFAAAHPRIVTPSQWLGDRLQEVPQLRDLPRRVIRYPIDCVLFSPQPDPRGLRHKFDLHPDRPTVVMSGHAWSDPFKGGDQAIAALRQAHAAVPDLQLLVIGKRSDELLRATGLGGRALPFLQGRGPLAEAYACADVCLFPSRAENYPLTNLEAMACGTPVVAYDVGGIPEQVDHLNTGFVASDGHPEQLATGIVHVAGDVDRARQMGVRGRDFVVHTSSVPVVVAQYEDEYQRAIEAWCRRRGRQTARRQRGLVARRIADLLGWGRRTSGWGSGSAVGGRP